MKQTIKNLINNYQSYLKTNLYTFFRLMTMCSLFYMYKSSCLLCCDSYVHRNGFQNCIRQYLRKDTKKSKHRKLISYRENKLVRGKLVIQKQNCNRCNCVDRQQSPVVLFSNFIFPELFTIKRWHIENFFSCSITPREEGAFTNLYTAFCHTSTHILSCKNNESSRRRSCRYDDNQREWPFPYFQKWFWDHTRRYLREILIRYFPTQIFRPVG